MFEGDISSGAGSLDEGGCPSPCQPRGSSSYAPQPPRGSPTPSLGRTSAQSQACDVAGSAGKGSMCSARRQWSLCRAARVRRWMLRCPTASDLGATTAASCSGATKHEQQVVAWGVSAARGPRPEGGLTLWATSTEVLDPDGPQLLFSPLSGRMHTYTHSN